jgi:hypothetical protein
MKRIGRIKMVWEETVQLWAEDHGNSIDYCNIMNINPIGGGTSTNSISTPPPPQQQQQLLHQQDQLMNTMIVSHQNAAAPASCARDFYDVNRSNATNYNSNNSGRDQQQNAQYKALMNVMASSSASSIGGGGGGGIVAEGRLKMENVSFLNADELVFLDESLTGNTLEGFEGGRLKGYSTHTFTPGQVVKVFGRRILSPAAGTVAAAGTATVAAAAIATPPPPPPPIISSQLLASPSPPTLMNLPPPHQLINPGLDLYLYLSIYLDISS